MDAEDFGNLFNEAGGTSHLFSEVQREAARPFVFEVDPKAPTSLGRPIRRKVCVWAVWVIDRPV